MTLKSGRPVATSVEVELRDNAVTQFVRPLTGSVESMIVTVPAGRPVDVIVHEDGSLLVSDDFAGAIYRIRYGKAAPEGRP